MLGPVLFALLCLDLAAFAHGDFSPDATALIAVVLALVAVFPYLRDRSRP